MAQRLSSFPLSSRADVRRDRHPDAFELLLDREVAHDSYVLRWRSRMFGVDRSLSLRRMWQADPRRLAEFVERLIGDTLHSWAELRVRNGHEMAQALMPMWESEIFAFMERLEYEARRREPPMYWDRNPIGPDQWNTVRYGGVFGIDWAAPKEDPKAKEKARQLLLRNLDDGQEKSFKKDGTFRVTAKDKKVYTIKTARSFNVVAEDGTKYCGQLADTPVEDQMLAQKLLLEHDPDKFFKNANVSPASTGTLGFVQSGTRPSLTIQDIERASAAILGRWDTV